MSARSRLLNPNPSLLGRVACAASEEDASALASVAPRLWLYQTASRVLVMGLLVLASLFTLFAASPAFAARTIEITEGSPDVRIPIQIWDQFGKVEGKDSVAFSPVTVRFVEKTPGVLIDPEVEVKLPRGGGQIDLSQIVRKNQQGTFRVFFDLSEMEDEKKMKAYFISRAKKRKIDDEVWGAGCRKYMDIKNFVLKAGKKTGIEVNTTRNRHDSVLGGTFFFSMDQQVTQVTFVDSQQPHLFCEATPEKSGGE